MNTGGFLKRNAVGIVIPMGCIGFVGLITSPTFFSARTSARRSNCQMNLKLIAMACQQYRADYDGHYPPLSDGDSRGWTILLQRGNIRRNPALSYSERRDLLQTGKIRLDFSCPESSGESSPAKSDYFFNARLATRKESAVNDPASTIAFGDGSANGPSNSHYWELPNDDDNPDSPLHRHSRSANYAFADGHVKSILSPSVFKANEQKWSVNLQLH